MSSIWTPEGERPVARQPSGAPPEGPEAGPTDADLEALRTQLAETPVASIVANHCVQLYELAALHLSLRPPQLAEAAVAIDALGALVEGLSGRLGDDEGTLHDALAQLRIAYVQIKGAATAATGDADGSDPGAPEGAGNA
ncbi:MAG: hypothetical protein NVSMB12_01860 [Acidimicrobiales bacterium]